MDIKLSANQELFLDKIINNKNIFLTGKAGTGKSFVVKQAIDVLKKRGKNVVAVAPTGVAANNINGVTLHSLFSLRPYGILDFEACNFIKKEKRRLMDKIDVIFIDEVSMLRPDLFDAINWTLIKNGCKSIRDIQIVLIGDLKQLPSPLNDNALSVLLQTYSGTEFYHAKIYNNLNFEVIELDEVLRQSDEDFIHALNVIRDGGKSEYFRKFVGKEQKGIVLAPHNTTVAQYNYDGLNKLDGKEYVFEAVIDGNVRADDFNLESTVKVKNGCKIMYLANSPDDNSLVNGTLGNFVVSNGKYFIDVKNVWHPIELMTFTKVDYVLSDDESKLELRELGTITQIPIKLAYALTIHKAQGLTFDEVTIDLTLKCFSPGQLYTALSRVKTPQGLTIITR